jgi:hypothetical protein
VRIAVDEHQRTVALVTVGLVIDSRAVHIDELPGIAVVTERDVGIAGILCVCRVWENEQADEAENY